MSTVRKQTGVPAHGTSDPGGASSAAHLVHLRDEWRLWRLVGLRGAGFPATQVLVLGATALARSIDRLLEREETARSAALQKHSMELQASRGERVEARRIAKVIRRLREGDGPILRVMAGCLPEGTLCDDPIWLALRDDYRAAKRAFEAERQRENAVLRAIAQKPRFREAVLWQNPQFVETALDQLSRKNDARHNSRIAATLRAIALYVQRYSVKNETIGFFGPVGIARIRDGGPVVDMEVGDELVARRTTFFEAWAIDAVAQSLARRPELFPWIPVRLLPHIELRDGMLRVAGRDLLALSPGEAQLLGACDGRRTVTEIVREAVAMGVARDAGHATEVLQRAIEAELVVCSLEVASQPHPERALRRLLERIGDADLRAECLGALDELEDAKEQVARASGDAHALGLAIGHLNHTFTRVTGTAPTRAHGRAYAARTLVYEDCLRAARVRLGPGFIAKAAPPLSLILRSARWITHEIGRRYNNALVALFRQMTSADACVDFTTFHLALMRIPSLNGKGARIAAVAESQRDLQRRWSETLEIDLDQRVVRYRSEDLRDRVHAAFAAPAHGWASARYVNPDLMIAAESADAANRGDFELVLGEVHFANTLLGSWFVSQYPDISELRAALEHDLEDGVVIPVTPKQSSTQRVSYGVFGSKDMLYSFSAEVVSDDAPRVLRVAELVVEEAEGILWVRTRDGRVRLKMTDFMSTFLSLQCAGAFRPFGEADHVPRVVIDDLVIQREQWSFHADDVSFARDPDGFSRFYRARRWARERTMPRFVFVKSPLEPKPCYLDLDSPVLVDTLARLVRTARARGLGSSRFSITEMLPTHAQCWLEDAEGLRYTSELRVVAIAPNREEYEVGPP